MGSKVNPSHELRCYSAACLAICWTFSSARLLRYVQRQPGVISDRFYSSCSYSLIQLGQTRLMCCFLHAVWMWEGGGDIFDSLWIFLLNASANPVTQLDGSITHECLARIWDFGFHRFENKKWSIQRGWKWQDIFRFSFLVLERALKEYRFPRKAV